MEVLQNSPNPDLHTRRMNLKVQEVDGDHSSTQSGLTDVPTWSYSEERIKHTTEVLIQIIIEIVLNGVKRRI